ncbi:MAG: DUF2330 domain-containing protein [Candidatus Omnitrophica bacterium]|nr:DUF2330 domain-containing protein [Candidatus Omnitrophota bacterium]
MSDHRLRFLGWVLVLPLCIFPTSALWADCGSIPFYAPTMTDFTFNLVDASFDALARGVEGARNRGDRVIDVSFDPLKVTVFEPKQRAIVLHNGTEQILLLSTDLKASQKTAVLEVIPLPAKPSVQLGSFETFEKAQRLVVQKRMWAMAHGGAPAGMLSLSKEAGKIHFSKKMGAHEVTVAQVLDPDGFVNFVQSHLKEKYGAQEAPIQPDFIRIIEDYLDDGFKWFAFDAIVVDESDNSREPIAYRFKSDRVFYPMRISQLERGETEVEMLVFTPTGVTEFGGLSADHFDREKQVSLPSNEVDSLSEQWTGFFGAIEDVVLDQWAIRGDISGFDQDVWVW